MAGPVSERVTDADTRHFDYLGTFRRISDALTIEETRVLKLYCSFIIPKGVAERLEKAEEVFHKLMELGKIGPDPETLDFLEELLERMGRQDLVIDLLRPYQQTNREIPKPFELQPETSTDGASEEEMARLYADACRQGSLPVYSTRVPVVGQYRSGKTCFIKRLMGETVRDEKGKEEPITDGINIISDVQTKTYKKSQEEIDELAGPLLRKQLMAEASAGDIAASKQAITADVNEYFDNVVTKVSHKWDDLARQLGSKTRNEIREIRASEPDDEHRCRKVLERWRNKMGEEATLQILNQALVAIDEYQAVETFEAQEKRPLPPSENLEKQMQPGGSKTPTKITEEVTNVEGEEEYTKEATESPETSTIPDIVVEAAEKMRKAGITEEDVGTAEHPRLSFWDFGGQATYYGTHHCFITHRGVYILVMSLLQKLSKDVPEQDYKASVDNLRTGGDYLDHWLNTVRSHTLQHQTGQPRRPPVIIVLTHKDKFSMEYIEKYKEEIRNHINDKAAGRLVMPKIFAVDNTTEDAAVDEIRDYIRQVAGGLPHMGEEIPISWLYLKSRLRKKREEGPFCKFQEVAELARDPDINITDEHTLALVLTFLHDRGDVIYFDEPSLRDDVTLQPQVLIDVFKTIITDPQYQKYQLERDGVLSDEMLIRIWEEKDRQLKKPFLLQHKTFLKALMEKFYLICNATPVGDANDEAQQEEIYFVPALLSCERDNARLYPSNMFICPQALYFVFSEQFLPSGMFSRLQALCVRRFGLQDCQESCVFAGCARFPTDDKEQAFVITKGVQVNHYLKVELLSSSNIFTEGLRVRKFLSSALFEIKEKWIPCIQYELCCSTQQVDGGEPAFRALPTEHWSLEQLWGIPSVFRAVWMPDGYQRDRTANSGGDGPVILQPLGDPDTIVGMRTIGPVLDTLEQGGGLALGQCDHIRNQLTPMQRVLDMRRQGEVDPYQLGAAVEMCSPAFVDLFLREKRRKELVILHSDDYTAEFVLPLQTAARESGLPCHTEVITGTDSITEKTVELLVKKNDRMVALVISPKTLHHTHWSNLDYEFQVLNQKLLLPILLYPKGSRDRMVRVLQQRSLVLFNVKRAEIQMEGGAVQERSLQEIVHNVLFGSIFSPLDEEDIKSLSRVWSARTGKQERQGIKRPQDLMRAMATTGYITAGDFEKLEKDMIASGISFPVIVRDNPGVPDEFQYQRTAEALVGPVGGRVEIPGFVELAAPAAALQTDTAITVSTVDIPRILRSPEGVSWTSGYPWSLSKNACPLEVLNQVLFSPVVKVNLHGAQLTGPVELKTWRPPGSDGMECILLKHHDGEGWTDITASTLHHIDSENISVCLSAFCTLVFAWAPPEKVEKVQKAMVQALSSRTLDCRFAGYIKPHEEGVEFHVVCRDQSIKTDEYLNDFALCRINDAERKLNDGDKIEVTVTANEGQEEARQMQLRADHCRRAIGQSVHVLLNRSNGKHVKGDVLVTKLQEKDIVCQFSFWEEGDIPSSVYKRGYGSDSGVSTPTEHGEFPVKKSRQSDDRAGPSGIRMGSWTKGGGSRKKSSSLKRPRGRTSRPLVSAKKPKESNVWQTDDGAGPSGAVNNNVEKYFDNVIDGVSNRWENLARKLGLKENKIKGMRRSETDDDKRCREVLNWWRNKNGRKATLQVLKQALIDIDERLTAENLEDDKASGESSSSSDD
ncbi:uncharacterized protein LOC144908097 [Branchiostoma floridae x Branchiostoma belcheri]